MLNKRRINQNWIGQVSITDSSAVQQPTHACLVTEHEMSQLLAHMDC
jgi:hypothetical protein